MEYEKYVSLDQAKFDILTCHFKSRCNLLLFLLNALLSIKSNGCEFCYCKQNKEYKLCKIRRIYCEYEYKLSENMFDLNFLIRCHADLYIHINKLFNAIKHCACCFLNEEFS